MVHWLLSTTRCETFALIGRCLRRGVIILQRAVEILQRVVDWTVRLQRPAISRNAPHRNRLQFDNNVAKKVGNARSCGSQFEPCRIFKQVRMFRRRVGEIAMWCVTMEATR